MLAVGARPSGVVLIDTSTGETRALEGGEEVTNLGFARGGSMLVITGVDGTVRLYDLDRDAPAGLVEDGTGSVFSSPSWYNPETDLVWVATHPETCAALARAVRMQRLAASPMVTATAALDELVEQIDHIELTGELARTAGRLAQEHGLRGYDAVHLAAADAVADNDVVLVTGDAELAAAAAARGLAAAVTSNPPA